jgi:DNA polymerase (family 10)
MNNEQIASAFSLLAKLMDIHGENSFKAKSYSTTAFTIDKLPIPLSETAREKIAGIRGIGDSAVKKVVELLETGEMQALNEMIVKTPEGILEMLNIKGIGPKKIATIWKEMEIETLGELLYACKENRLKLYKGFGDKTQASVEEAINFYFRNKGSFLYAQMELLAPLLLQMMREILSDVQVMFTGAFKRKLETIDELDIALATDISHLQQKLTGHPEMELLEQSENTVLYKSAAGPKLRLHCCTADKLLQYAFEKGCSTDFLEAMPKINYSLCQTEQDIFSQAGLQFIPEHLREASKALQLASQQQLPQLIENTDIAAIIHSHSNWSDGSNSIEEMAIAAREQGLQYLVISDHSKSAFYASGLHEDRIMQQHQYIDELNRQLAPFKIFKSIESDILNDGSLDYSPAILSTFDLIIASVHSNLKMQEDKAMMRLMNAIQNPYTSILGHMTGRLLLSRKGYPVDHRAIIDACAANQVVLELNAHPSRLDIDWRHIEYALEKNVLISINPDAHFIKGYSDTRYGVLVAQKALVTKANNLSSFSLAEFDQFVQQQQAKRPLL